MDFMEKHKSKKAADGQRCTKSSLNVITKALLAVTLSAATAQSQCIASSAFDYDLRPRNNISVLKRYVTIIIKDHNGFGVCPTDDNNGPL